MPFPFPEPESEIDEILTLSLPLQLQFHENGLPLLFDDENVENPEFAENVENPEVFPFRVDINQLLLVINRFWSNPEVFLREIICNSSDALGKFRLQSLGCHPQLSVNIVIDKTNNTLSIIDNGVGMTKADLVLYLGTIARSGTKEFMESHGVSDLSMIGEFGCCFYTAFLVAEKVIVTTKHDDDEQYIWESQAGGFFTVTRDVNGRQLGRGTKVTLFLKEDQLEYLDEWRIKDLVKKHSEFISHPIYLWTGGEWQIINNPTPCWLRKPEEVSMDEYDKFFKSLTSDGEDLLALKHFSMEGKLGLKGILCVPKSAPFNLFDTRKKCHNIKLYVRRVLVMDNSDQLVPQCLEFVKGIICCDQLPLNMSRGMPQQNMILEDIRKNLVKKCIEMFSEIAENKEVYTKFYEAFSKNLGAALCTEPNWLTCFDTTPPSVVKSLQA